MSMILAAKCAPDEKIFGYIEKADIHAVELYTNIGHLRNINNVKQCCKIFPFRYAVHAPNDEFEMEALADIVDILQAEMVVLHNIYWEDEWKKIVKIFGHLKTKLCIENTYSALEPLKFMRRYGIGMCLDLEHVQMECAGIFDEALIPFVKKASHIHMTGYFYGSDLWHTHIHQSPEHSIYILNLLKKADYQGFVVSEARTSLQTYDEFKRLNDFFVNLKYYSERLSKC